MLNSQQLNSLMKVHSNTKLKVNDNKPGYTYDDSVLEAEVTVANVYGQKIASVKYKDSRKEFTNTYMLKKQNFNLKLRKS